MKFTGHGDITGVHIRVSASISEVHLASSISDWEVDNTGFELVIWSDTKNIFTTTEGIMCTFQSGYGGEITELVSASALDDFGISEDITGDASFSDTVL